MMNTRVLIAGLCGAFVLTALPLQAQRPKKEKKAKSEQTKQTALLDARQVRILELYGDATTQKIIGNAKEALGLYLEVIQLDPMNAAALYEAASIYTDNKQYLAARELCERAYTVAPDNKWYAMLTCELQRVTGDYKSAEKTMLALIKKNPEDVDYQYDLAELYLDQKKYKEVIEVLDAVEKKIGIDENISFQKQKLYEDQGKFDQAIREIERLIAAFPDDMQYYGVLAEVQLNAGKKQDALKSYQKVLEKDPSNPIIHLALANYYQDMGDGVKTFEYLQLAFENPEVEIDNKIKIMLSYYDLAANDADRKKEAYRLLDILMQTHPEEPKVHSIAGDFYLRDNELKKAQASFEKVINQGQSKYLVWQQLLKLDAGLQDWENLVKHGNQAIEVFPSFPEVYYYAGLGYHHLEKYTQAIEMYTTGKEFVVDNQILKSDFWALIGESAYKNKQIETAFDAFDNALKSNAKNVLVLNNYAFYLAEQNKQLQKAKDLALKAIQLEKENATYLDTYGWVLYKLQEYKEAAYILEQALKLGGDQSTEILDHYGDILFKLNRVEEAVAHWKKALSLDSTNTKIEQKIIRKSLVE